MFSPLLMPQQPALLANAPLFVRCLRSRTIQSTVADFARRHMSRQNTRFNNEAGFFMRGGHEDYSKEYLKRRLLPRLPPLSRHAIHMPAISPVFVEAAAPQPTPHW